MSSTSDKIARGRKVKLRYEITTKGGVKFPKGSIMRVDYLERCGLSRSMRNPNVMQIFGPSRLSVRCVKAHDVELLPAVVKEASK